MRRTAGHALMGETIATTHNAVADERADEAPC